MIRKKAIFLSGVAFLLIMLAFGASFFGRSDGTVTIGMRQWIVESASEPASRAQGLGSREFLSPGRGMLFLFPDVGPGKHAFWMKGMRFPLDIAWIRENRVIFIERSIPADSQDVFYPPEDADSVLEVNAGEMKGVMIGDRVER